MDISNYSLTDLGPYTQYSDDPRISAGTVIGGQDRPSPAGHPQAAIWNGVWTLIPDPPGTQFQWSMALAGISDRVVGYFVPIPGDETATQPALWERSAGNWILTPLPLPANSINGAAMAANISGNKVVGQVGDIDGTIHAILWSKTGALNWSAEVLPQTASLGFAIGIDDATGDVIGTMLKVPTEWKVVRWQLANGVWTVVELPSPGDSFSEAYSDDVIVGNFTASNGTMKAAIWDATGQLHDLGINSDAKATSHWDGIVVGVRDVFTTDSRKGQGKGFVWSATEGMSSIHPPDWEWSFPTGIDQSGQIVGVMGNGPMGGIVDARIFLLTPTLTSPKTNSATTSKS